jgi:hypothetical protein
MSLRAYGALAGVVAIAAAVGIAQIVSTGAHAKRPVVHVSKQAATDSSEATPGEGPVGTLDDFLAAQRAYPADVVPPAVADQAEETFNAIAAKDAHDGDPKAKGKWDLYGPVVHATEPGVLAFSGATNDTASRTTALVVSPDCGAPQRKHDAVCRVWVGASGGGVWTTDNALAPDPSWTQVSPDDLDQNSVGVLALDPTDKQGDGLYLGTGEANRCTSGCEAGVGLYTSKDGGKHWKHLKAQCVSNATYPCATPNQDAFLGRGIRAIVVDPNHRDHLFVGSALAVRGLSHVIGGGGQTRIEPGANAPGLYESTDGGDHFTMVWDGNAKALPGGTSFGINDAELDPLDPNVVYASAFDAGLWRRDAGAGQTSFNQVFAPQFVPPSCSPAPGSGTCAFNGTDRTMFALTSKNGHTRIYLTDGTQNVAPTGLTGTTSPYAANFWRIDNANQPAATLLASQAAGATVPAGAGNPFPATYNGWQKLTSNTTASPYYATIDFCTAQCWYDENVYTPAGLPDTVYIIGSYQYGELPCNTKGVGCGNGRSNGRAVIYSTTAGDPDPTAAGAGVNRTFTDLTFDSQNVPASWCALGSAELTFGGVTAPNQCTWAADSIHPDQHVIAVNPSNPTQIFEGSDGGLIRTSGDFGDLSSRCNTNERPLLGAASLANCGRLLSRVPTRIDHIDTNYSSTLQFVNVAINPLSSCEVMGGTQDNGTWSNLNGCDNNTWPQVIYGDGGNAGYDKTTAWRFNEFTSGASDSNFENGDPTKWVITSAPVVRSGEGPAFYWPQISDPNPPAGTHPIFSGAKHVWRTWAFGAGKPHAVPQDKSPDIAGYEKTCPEFTAFSNDPNCGDYQPLGGPYCENPPTPPATPTYPACINGPGDLTGTGYGTDRSGGVISWLARVSTDHGTLWAATGAGRIFVTHNADAVDPATVTWHRIDNASSPTRYPSGIYVDPADPSHAWVSYSGYNANTPATPGHVFDVHENGTAPNSGTFRNLDVESAADEFPTPSSDGDLPVADVVRDDATQTLYAATDFGVLRGDDDGTRWHVTKGMPRYEVMHLEIQPSSRVPTCTAGPSCPRVLYAATHSQGVWRMDLGEAKKGNGNDGNGGKGKRK